MNLDKGKKEKKNISRFRPYIFRKTNTDLFQDSMALYGIKNTINDKLRIIQKCIKLDQIYIWHDKMTHLLGVSELVPVALVHAARGSLWVTRHCFNVNLQTALQQLIHLAVVIIVISADTVWMIIFQYKAGKTGFQCFWLSCASTLGGAMGVHTVYYSHILLFPQCTVMAFFIVCIQKTETLIG